MSVEAERFSAKKEKPAAGELSRQEAVSKEGGRRHKVSNVRKEKPKPRTQQWFLCQQLLVFPIALTAITMFLKPKPL